jgi:hypothetical protein
MDTPQFKGDPVKSINLISIFAIFLFTIQACSGAAIGPVGNKVLFSDNFNDTSKKWNSITSDAGSTDYFEGAYRILVNVIDAKAWANPDNESFTDARIEVNATKNSGPENNDFGIICRYLDENQFYYAVISSDGYYAIMKMTSSGSRLIGDEAMLESNKILKGAVTNHIRFDCIGSTLTLYINGSQIDQHTDVDYATGNVGLLAGTFDTPGTEILFDNFFVYKP